MTAAPALEGRYRRLLAMYPAEHRRKHQDEMLGVLMTGARAGQHRPGLADTANLVWGALLIRLRPARPGTAWPLWRDALAVVSVLLPLVVLAYSGLLNVATLATLRVGSPIFNALAGSDAKFLGGWTIVAALALLRLRRTAALTSVALLIWLVYSSADVPNWSYIDAPSMRSLCVAGLEIAALMASPGPRRAMQIINWRHYALALAIPLGLASVVNWVWLVDPAVSNCDRDHGLRGDPGRDDAGLPAGQAGGGLPGPPGLLPHRDVPRAALDDRRSLRVTCRGGRDRCGSR